MKSKKFPSFSQWKQFFKTLKKTEKRIFLVLVCVAIVSLSYLIISVYLKNTVVSPGYGGTYIEGVVGQPRFINPIYGETNDIDRTLISLVYSGLMAYNKDNGLEKDLAKDYQISDNGRTYTFQLQDNLFWQDGSPLTADDIIYTIKTIKNSDYKSPLRANWLNVEVAKISDKSVSFTLNAPYNSFLENCTLKIIPEHIWKNVLPENFALSAYNLQPTGSGPYTLNNLTQNNTGYISKIELIANRRYYGKVPYISKITFDFFSDKEGLIKAANQKTIDGFSVSSIGDDEGFAEKEIVQGWSDSEKFQIYNLSIPRYFAVFFNTQKSKLLSDPNITQALSFAVDKQELVKQITTSTNDKISVVDSPILSDYFGYNAPTVVYNYNTDSANKLLDKSGYKTDSSGMRSKANDKKPAFQFKSYLKVGSKGSEVTELQACLSRLDSSFKSALSSETTGTYGKGTENAVNEFQKKYIPDAKVTGETGPGTRTKLNELCLAPQSNSIALQFTLTTINQPQILKAANILKDQWQKVGVAVTVKSVELSELKTIIKNRDYDALLYGQALGLMPDLYPFWHSTQINDPGLNLSGYQNKTTDQLLRDARESTDYAITKQKYEQLQDIILKDAPAVFLYNPNYVYWVSKKVKGIDTTEIVDPAKRFENINNWYINTHRIFK
jgi:ABC-type transport system substrate-binding protein